MEGVVEGERYSKPAVVKVEALKPRKETQFPDSYTRWLDAARKERAEQKAQELEAMVADGSFLALTKRKPSNKNKKKAAAAAQAARRKAAPAPRQPTAAQATALDGATFEDDGISWRVLKVEWSGEYESILVYYYDVEAVASRGKAEADLDDEDEDVEASSIKEVLDWIKKTS